MTTLVGLLTAAATAIVLAALGHILLAGIAAVVLCAIAVTLLLFARRPPSSPPHRQRHPPLLKFHTGPSSPDTWTALPGHGRSMAAVQHRRHLGLGG